jgi:hypothetical protein
MNQSASRPSTLQEIRTALRGYAAVYHSRCPETKSPDEFIDGSSQNIEDAGWLYYEGTDFWFPGGMLDSVLPWLAMNALVVSCECEWIIDNNSVSAQYPLLKERITFDSLIDQTWIPDGAYDEPYTHGEIAVESYLYLNDIFAKKRIHGVKPLR